MIKYIYTGSKGTMKYGEDLDLLFQVLCLADKYLLEEMKNLVTSNIETLPVSLKNYASVFVNCAKYGTLMGLEKLCGDLRDRCALTILKKWKSAEDSVLFWTQDCGDDAPLKQALVQRQGELAAMKCSSCGLSKAKCPIGDILTYDNCAVEMRVKAVRPRCPRGQNDNLKPGAVCIVKEYSQGQVPEMSTRDDKNEASYSSEIDDLYDNQGFMWVLWSEEKDRDGIEKGFSKLATDRTLKIYTMKWLNNLVIVSH
jgi:hypothetical protein